MSLMREGCEVEHAQLASGSSERIAALLGWRSHESLYGTGAHHRRGGSNMTERESWQELRDRRLAEPAAAEAYEATRTAYELGKTVRTMRAGRGWSQRRLAR